jgi:hypothetical protein
VSNLWQKRPQNQQCLLTHHYSTIATSWYRDMNLKTPTTERPHTSDELELTASWQPYPIAGSGPTPFHANRETDERCNLFEIMAQSLPLLLSGGPEDSPLPGHAVLGWSDKQELARTVEEKMLAWMDQLPATVKLDDETIASTQPVSPIFDLQ